MRKELEPFLITLVCLLSRLRSFPIPPLLSPVKKSSCKLFSLAADTVQLFASVSVTQFPVSSFAVSNASDKVKKCTFDDSMCDWHNVPFDDDMDFVIKSSISGGPSSGAGGSGKWLPER